MNKKMKHWLCEWEGRFLFDNIGFVDEDYMGVYIWRKIGKIKHGTRDYVIVKSWAAPINE